MTRRSLLPSRSLAPDEAWGVPAVFSRDGTHAGDRPDGCPRLLQAAGFDPKRRSRSTASEPPGLPLKALPVSRRCPYHFISDRGASSFTLVGGAAAWPLAGRTLQSGRAAGSSMPAEATDCEQRICKHDDKTAFPIELSYDENDCWLDVRGGACCEQCSQLADRELGEDHKLSGLGGCTLRSVR